MGCTRTQEDLGRALSKTLVDYFQLPVKPGSWEAAFIKGETPSSLITFPCGGGVFGAFITNPDGDLLTSMLLAKGLFMCFTE